MTTPFPKSYFTDDARSSKNESKVNINETANDDDGGEADADDDGEGGDEDEAVEDEEDETENSKSLESVQLVQVVPEDGDGKCRPVIGGYESSNLNEKYTITLKHVGEYLFKLLNHPANPPMLRITVVPEQPTSILITDDGFMPKIIQIDEGTSIKWVWTKLAIAHSIYQAEYCDTHHGLYRTSKELAFTTLSNSYQRKFDEPGVFYFQTESRQRDQNHVCIVQVAKSYRYIIYYKYNTHMHVMFILMYACGVQRALGRDT